MTIDTQISELQAAQEAVASPLEGFRDLERVLTPRDGDAAKNFAHDGVNAYDTRDRLLGSALEALLALKAHGYPEDPKLIAPSDVAGILQKNVQTQAAAFGKITVVGDATDADITIGTPIPR